MGAGVQGMMVLLWIISIIAPAIVLLGYESGLEAGGGAGGGGSSCPLCPTTAITPGSEKPPSPLAPHFKGPL